MWGWDTSLTYSGYYAFKDDCVMAEGEYFHEIEDADDYIYDEMDECYIFADNANWVNGRRDGFYTHDNNCQGCNEIYRYNGEWINEEYMEYNGLVFDCNGEIAHTDDVYYWECDGEYHHSPESDDDDDDDDDDCDMDAACINSYSYRPAMKFHKLSNEN